MALQAVGTIWSYKNRACVVEGHGTKRVPKKPGWHKDLVWNYHQVRFLDGVQPFQADLAEKEFSLKSKPIRGAQLAYFKRIAELRRSGIHICQAILQARAELAKGIGQPDIVDNVLEGKTV